MTLSSRRAHGLFSELQLLWLAAVSATALLFVSRKSRREAEQVSALAIGISSAGSWQWGWLAWLGFASAIAVLVWRWQSLPVLAFPLLFPTWNPEPRVNWWMSRVKRAPLTSSRLSQALEGALIQSAKPWSTLFPYPRSFKAFPVRWVTAQLALPSSPCRCALQSYHGPWGSCCTEGPSAEADNWCRAGSRHPSGCVRCSCTHWGREWRELIYLKFLLETALFFWESQGKMHFCILCPLFS